MLNQRQVHLDFHTSPFIDDVASEFDAEKFADTMAKARVNSVTVFAKCHHGMSYYPTKTGVVHPALKGRDLLGEQIAALHKRGIRAPVYYTVGWEEYSAFAHPEWRQLRKDGGYQDSSNGNSGANYHPGAWKFMDWLHPAYQALMLSQVDEILDNYDTDGLFFDILIIGNDCCWGDAARALRAKLDAAEPPRRHSFEHEAQDVFIRKFTRHIKAKAPDATVFFNCCNNLLLGTPNAWVKTQTHIEIESLPSGYWGYHHFPRIARYVAQTGKPWLGMTGRFQTAWGDFGGIKPQAALEYECFRNQAMGGASSVGDQLPPRGTPDPAAYELIGAVYSQIEAAEPFYENAEPIPRVGIVSPEYPGNASEPVKSLEGAVMMCEEAHYDCAVLKEDADFSRYDLLILPDSVPADEDLIRKLGAFHKRGGKLVLSANSVSAAPFLPLTSHGVNETFPAFWRARKAFMPEMSVSDRVFYKQGTVVTGGAGTKTLVDRVLPYFKRTDLKFCSHLHTPPTVEPSGFPAVIGGKNFVCFADPVFLEYRQSGNIAVRDVWKKCMENLVGEAPFGAGLPTTVNAYPMRRGKDLIVTLLHYIPVRKALDIDVIEERSSFAGEFFKLEKDIPALFQVTPGGKRKPLKKTGPRTFALPAAKGRLLLEAVNYF